MSSAIPSAGGALMECPSQELSGYRVEVSGWDSSDRFFVEKTLFSWVGEEKEISIRCALRQGSLVFVRLLQPLASHANIPVAYQVNRIGRQDADGKSKVYLAQLHPHLPRKEEADLCIEAIHTA
jgi:hypothetical protein